MLRRAIRGSYVASLAMVTLGLILVMGGALAIPIAGWGAAYVAAIGLWLSAAARLPAFSLIAAALIHRKKTGTWYFGNDESRPE